MPERTYDWDPAEYAQHSAAQSAWAHELIAKLGLAGHETVLDIGCGDGKVTARLADNTPEGQVIGIDRSWGMVALASQQFGAIGNLAFAQMDAAQLGFSALFDVAFSNATLHWIRDQRSVLEGVARSLKPGGRLLFQMGGKGNAAEIVACLDEVIARPPWTAFFQDFAFPYTFPSPAAYESLLRESGLVFRRIELIPKDMQHAGQPSLAGWIRTTWLPYLERVPQEAREDLIGEIIETYMQRHPPDTQDILHVQMARLEVEASKPG